SRSKRTRARTPRPTTAALPRTSTACLPPATCAAARALWCGPSTKAGAPRASATATSWAKPFSRNPPKAGSDCSLCCRDSDPQNWPRNTVLYESQGVSPKGRACSNPRVFTSKLQSQPHLDQARAGLFVAEEALLRGDDSRPRSGDVAGGEIAIPG